MEREFDVIIFGATGFTGSLVAEYFARHYLHSDVKWALAGRSAEKLQRVREEVARLVQEDKINTSVELIIADAKDQDALNRMARRTRVVLTTAGPFWLYGPGVVQACVSNGTSYADITGESPFVSEMIAKYEDEAIANQCRIVSFCGFDSIPSDFGAYVVTKELKEKHGVETDRIDTYITKMKGGVSGGTIASMLNILDRPSAEFNKLAKALGNPYELMPRDLRPKFRQPDVRMPWYSSEISGFVYPFVMASVNSKVVHRSNALRGMAYGKQFKYCEQMTARFGIGGALTSVLTTAGLAAFMTAAFFGWSRNMIKGYLPQPGDGPSREDQSSGSYKAIAIGKGVRKEDGTVPVVKASLTTSTDPGYSATARMLAESAICLAKDGDKIPARYGFLTPSVAMGDVLLRRLAEHAGVVIKVIDPAEKLPTSRL